MPPPPPDFLAELSRLNAGFSLVFTREHGLKIVPVAVADHWLDTAPMADDDEPIPHLRSVSA